MLEVQDVTRSFDGRRALDGVSLTVEPGQSVGFVGPNGAGKTTTMRIILGLLAPDAGEVRWQGAPLDEPGRQRIGYMPEERGLYPRMRIGDQLTWLARLHGADAKAAVRASDHWTERLGLADRRGEEVESLSLGNQQRVQLAAALVHDPELLILDEPFSGLDPTGVDALAEVLVERAAAGAAILFSSHQLELVERQCEAVVIITGGTIHTAGAVADLRAAGGGTRVRVQVEGADAAGDWARAVPGVRGVRADRGAVVVELADDAGVDDVIDAARAAGTLLHFSHERPTLAELYREAVAPPDPDAEDAHPDAEVVR
ncbi:ABC transporter [Paraconexibacter sp. AEG42_29]|uniref:ABC transporter n=1 Tax=Paraconexibacter sp. AEG42_29 TaxID=2997339 RepID=A0AAU7B1I7_9ACTN